MTAAVIQPDADLAADVRLGSNLLVHLGFPKTGSTWLQEHVFDRGDLGLASPWGQRAGVAIDYFVLTNDFDFDPERIRHAAEAKLRQAAQQGLVAVLSEETLICNQLHHLYWGYRVIEKLHQCFPRARVLLCIREQVAMAYSSYCEHMQDCGFLELGPFIGVTSAKSGHGARFRRDYFRYDLIVAHLHKLFGPEQVLVLPMELMRLDLTGFRNRILAFAGRAIPAEPAPASVANPSLGGLTIRFQRKFNQWWPYHQELPSRLVGKIWRAYNRLFPRSWQKQATERMKQHIRQSFGDYYRASNARTAELIGIDLKALGYDA